ncbi:hypothetical protein ACS0TY_016402 [Phlomoides rotata]
MESVKRRKVELPQDKSYICQHPADFKGMCVRCGRKIENDGDGDGDASRVSLRYLHENFRISNGDLLRLRASYSKILLRRKKLFLVLDLDHTLLHSCIYDLIKPCEEEYFKEAVPDDLIRMDHLKLMTKLRPFVRTFLKEASDLFQLCIYTMGNRWYALQMAKLLDPENVYFNCRIISRDDCTVKNEKSLDLVLGHENATIVVDDTKRMWEKHEENLIEIGRYHYFASKCKNCKSVTELRCDESESDGQLAAVLEILKGVHSSFFDGENEVNLEDRDVREVLKSFRKKIQLLQEK